MTRDPAATCARHAVRSHDENFPVLFRLLDRARREDLAAIYWFCRTTDDIGDEAVGDRLVLLDKFEFDVRRAIEHTKGPAHLRGLARAAHRRQIGTGPFLRLIEANRMDQRQNRWESHDELLHYCEHSATPVGAMVLAVLGHRDPGRLALSDATCIGLQLANFWHDIGEDLHDLGRIYLPTRDMYRFGVTESDLKRPAASEAVRSLVEFEVERARDYLQRGAPLARRVGWRARLDIACFTAGGLALCDAIAAQNYDTLSARPAPGRRGRARIVGQTLVHILRVLR